MEQKYVLKCTYGIVICLSIALLVSSDASMNETKTCCKDIFGLNYTLPMFSECQKKGHPNGSMVQTIPKLIPNSFGGGGCPRRESKLGVPPGRRVCRFPDCDMNPCENGWCEETMTGYRCHCPIGFQGKQCHELDTNQPATTKGIVVTCVEDITVTVELGTLNKSVEFTPPSAFNIEGTVVLVSQNYKSGDDFPVGSTLVEYIFADESGNQASLCTFNVNVNTVDTIPPVVQSCPSNQTFSVLITVTPVTWTPPTASDASGIAFIVANYEPGVIVFVNSPIDVFYTVIDNNGLVNTTCSFNIALVSVETEWSCTSSKCHRVDEKPRSWKDARDFCPTLGPITTVAGERTPTLLFADTEEGSQSALIKGLLWIDNVVWINCYEMETEGLYMCDVDGTEAVQINSTSKNWESGYPLSGDGNEQCVSMNEEYKWRGGDCNHALLSICQIVL